MNTPPALTNQQLAALGVGRAQLHIRNGKELDVDPQGRTNFDVTYTWSQGLWWGLVAGTSYLPNPSPNITDVHDNLVKALFHNTDYNSFIITATLHHATETRRIMHALLRKHGGQIRLTADELNTTPSNMASFVDADGSIWISIDPATPKAEPNTDWEPGDPIYAPPTPKTCAHCGNTSDADIDECTCGATLESQ